MCQVSYEFMGIRETADTIWPGDTYKNYASIGSDIGLLSLLIRSSIPMLVYWDPGKQFSMKSNAIKNK